MNNNLPNPAIQKVQNEFNRIMKERLYEIPFQGSPSHDFQSSMLKGLEYILPKDLNLTDDEFEVLYSKLELGRVLSCYEFACASNNFDMRCITELKIQATRWFKLRKEGKKLQVIWKEQTQAIHDGIMFELGEKYKKPGNGVPPLGIHPISDASRDNPLKST